MAKEENKPYELTDAERLAVDKAWGGGENDIKLIVKKVCGAKYTLRDPQGVAVRKYLAERTQKKVVQVDADSLTNTQKEFVVKHIMMRPIEIARMMFNDDKLPFTSNEFRAVKAYYDTVDSPDKPSEIKKETDDLVDSLYYPPRSFTHVFTRVNKYTAANYKEDKMTPNQKESLTRLMGYMNINRFSYEMNSLRKKSERELFESTFIRMCYDKPDLTEEEVEMYVSYCEGKVRIDRMKKEEADLVELKERITAEEKMPPMSVVELINNTRSQIDSTTKRLDKVLQDLNGKRADRLGKLGANSESVLKLIEAFRDANERKKVVQYLEFRKERRKQEVERITSMDDLRAQLFGVAEEEIV